MGLLDRLKSRGGAKTGAASASAIKALPVRRATRRRGATTATTTTAR
jgi:hypothetical protein